MLISCWNNGGRRCSDDDNSELNTTHTATNVPINIVCLPVHLDRHLTCMVDYPLQLDQMMMMMSYNIFHYAMLQPNPSNQQLTVHPKIITQHLHTITFDVTYHYKILCNCNGVY